MIFQQVTLKVYSTVVQQLKCKGMSALIDLLDIPRGTLMLIIGSPGAGKSTFTCKVQLYQVLDRGADCISVVTEQTPDSIRRYMTQLDARFPEREEKLPLIFVDAYRKTVGLKGGGTKCVRLITRVWDI